MTLQLSIIKQTLLQQDSVKGPKAEDVPLHFHTPFTMTLGSMIGWLPAAM